MKGLVGDIISTLRKPVKKESWSTGGSLVKDLSNFGKTLETGRKAGGSGLLGYAVKGAQANAQATPQKPAGPSYSLAGFYEGLDNTKKTPSLGGTPVGPTQTEQTSLTPEQQKEADARKYLEDENAASLKYGSKSLVDMMRGDKSGDTTGDKTDEKKKEDTPTDYTVTGDKKITDTTKTNTGSSILDQLRKKVSSLSAPSAEEAALNDQLAQFRGDASQGIAGLEGQGRGIPVTLIRGQQAKLSEQANLQQQTLLDRITAASAQRQAQLTAAQNEYNMASDEQARQEKLTAPTTVGNSILQFDPTTGTYKTLYTAPEETTTDTDRYTSANGVIYDKQTGEIVNTIPGGDTSGGFTIGNTRYNADGSVLVQGSDAQNLNATQQADLVNISTAEQTIDSLLAMAGAGNIPGLGLWQGRLPGATLSPEGQQARAMLGTIRSQIAKANAGTSFTADEQRLLEESLPTPTDSDSMLLTKLNTLKTMLSNKRDAIYQVSGGQQGAGVQSDPRYQQLKNSGFSDDEINEYLGKANGASGSAQQIAAAIGQYESGGNYNAIGPQTSRGDKAYGKYQVMGANIPSWTKEALGYSMTPQQFLSNPEAQDAVAEYKMGQYLKKYGNIEDVASLWFSGRPLSGNTSSDVLGTSVPQYVKGVSAIYNKIG